ncbi:hypothetical protein, partial [Peptostreptococcus porci]|uniref:hypothetical protein n=1 Tax=Peptostreptococcus porci TaxID=2652282 RepID=UPI002A909C44
QNGNEIHRTSHQGFILNQRFDEMDCLVQQRAGWEPEQFFDKDELRATGIDAPSFAEVNKSYRYDNALNTDANGVDWQLKYGAFDLLTEKVDGEGNRWLPINND